MSSIDDHQSDASPQSTPPADVPRFAPASPFAEYLQPPRLGIIHLLAWTAVTAVLLKFNQGMEMLQTDTGASLGAAFETASSILQCAYAAVGAAGLVGAATVLMTKIRRTPGNFQPGHWIILVYTAAMLMSYLSWVLRVLLEESLSGDYMWPLLLTSLIYLLYAGGYVVAAWKATAPRRWTAYFLLRVLVLLANALTYVVTALTQDFGLLSWGWSIGWSAILGIGLLTVVLLDLRRRARRDWVHWMGVALVAAGVLLRFGWWMAIRLIEPQT